MLKKTWILLLAVLLLTGSAYGTLVDVVVASHDDNDLSGTYTSGDVIHIKIVSSVIITAIDFSLQVNGNGTLAEKGTHPTERMGHHAGFSIWYPYPDQLVIDNNSISILSGAALSAITPGAEGTVDLVWNLKIVCGDPGTINVDLQLNGTSLYKNDPGDLFYSEFTEDDLGDLLIQVQGKELTVQVVGDNGTIQVNGDDDTITTEPLKITFPLGAVVQLKANPDPGYRVKSWNGAYDRKSMRNTNTVTMNKNKRVKVKFEPIPDDGIRKALLKAGKTRELQKDSFLILGTLSAAQSDILDADEVLIRVGTVDDPNIFYDAFTVNDEGYKLMGHQAGFQFKGSGELGKIKRLNVNVKSGKFVLMATDQDLAGLTSPVRLEMRFGQYQQVFSIDEDIINGRNRYIPMQYLQGVEDALRVEKQSIRINRKDDDLVSVTLKGAIALEEPLADPNYDLRSGDPNGVITISWDDAGSGGDFSETIPAPGGIITKHKINAKYSYKRPKSATDYYVTSVVFDLTKCTFNVTIKDAVLGLQDLVTFSVQFKNDRAGIFFDEVFVIDPDS